MRFNLDSGKYICDKCNFSLDECQCFKKHEFDDLKKRIKQLEDFKDVYPRGVGKEFGHQNDYILKLYDEIKHHYTLISDLQHTLIDISLKFKDQESVSLKNLDYEKQIGISVTADDAENIINHPDFIPESCYTDVLKYFGEIGKIGVVRFKRDIKHCDNELDKTLNKRCELDSDLHDFLSTYVRYINDGNLLEQSNEKYNKILDKWGK